MPSGRAQDQDVHAQLYLALCVAHGEGTVDGGLISQLLAGQSSERPSSILGVLGICKGCICAASLGLAGEALCFNVADAPQM